MYVYIHIEVLYMIITFCGHSSYLQNTDDEKRLLHLIEEIACGRQITFYLGGYGNFDCFARECAQKYKATHNDSRIVFITPYINKWLNDRKELLEKDYDEVIYPELENTPLKFAIRKRNEWMIQKSDYVFAYVERHFGGAYNSLLYAYKHKKPYINLYSGNFELY